MKGIVLNRINIIMIDTAEFSNPLFWVDVGISCIIIALVMFVTCFFLRRKLPIIIVSCGCALILISKFLGLNLVSYISIAFTAASLLLFFNVNIASIRTFITNPVSTKSSKFHKSNVEKVYDRYELCEKIATTVIQLSKTNTGALITFEKEDCLDDKVNTIGTVLNAPVVPELLLSIFYFGTRLHDGAVIIRRDKIYSAAAYFPPTNKPLAGKFGSRHRAALGISEISDSITVVVSEETGRISFAIDGELIRSSAESFQTMLEDYLINDNK